MGLKHLSDEDRKIKEEETKRYKATKE